MIRRFSQLLFPTETTEFSLASDKVPIAMECDPVALDWDPKAVEYAPVDLAL